MIRLVESYARFSPTIEESRLEAAAPTLLAIAEEITRNHYEQRYPGIALEVSTRLEQASTKAWVTITGAAAKLVQAISQYGSFRDGLDQLIHDTKTVSAEIVRHLPAVLGIPEESPATRQTRLGVPGKLRRLFLQVERGLLTPEEATRRALNVIESHRDELGREAPVLFERLKREIEEAAPSEQLTIGGISERTTAADPKLPRPKQRMPPLFVEPVRRRVRRVGVVATRDERTGDIRLRSYSLDT